MPELPEVETIRRQLDERLQGCVIRSIEILKSGRETPRGRRFVDRLAGQKISHIVRRAKLLIWQLENGSALLAHLKMTGRVLFVDSGYVPQKHDHVIFNLETPLGEKLSLVWSDIRQFGFLKLVNQKELAHILTQYGPEPLEHSPEHLAACLLEPKTRNLKVALLDQQTIAGIGNIYADEACHRAGLRPTRRLGSLTARDRLRLAEAIQSVLKESLAQQGTSANDYVDTRGERGGFLSLLRVYGRKGEPCSNCGTPIKKIVLAQRGTHYCPDCQC